MSKFQYNQDSKQSFFITHQGVCICGSSSRYLDHASWRQFSVDRHWSAYCLIDSWRYLRYASDRFTLHHIRTHCPQGDYTIVSTLIRHIACLCLFRFKLTERFSICLQVLRRILAFAYGSTEEEEELWRNLQQKGHDVYVVQPRAYSHAIEEHLWWKVLAVEKFKSSGTTS